VINEITRSVIEEKITNLEEGLTNDREQLDSYEKVIARIRERITFKESVIHGLKASLTREDVQQ
jgi:hypothetical protein